MLFERLTEIYDEVPHPAALNMAIDEVLLVDRLRASGPNEASGPVQVPAPILRLYRWASPAVTFGYFTKHAQVAARWEGRELVRRMTGGGIVPHGTDLTYSLIVPAMHPFSQLAPGEIYRKVHEVVARALTEQGEPATLAKSPEAAGTGVCFESPEEFDLLVRGSKIAGAALRRSRDGLLFQGSIQELSGVEQLRPRLARAFSADVQTGSITADELDRAGRLAAAKYATDEWNRRV